MSFTQQTDNTGATIEQLLNQMKDEDKQRTAVCVSLRSFPSTLSCPLSDNRGTTPKLMAVQTSNLWVEGGQNTPLTIQSMRCKAMLSEHSIIFH